MGTVGVLRVNQEVVTLISSIICNVCGREEKHEKPSKYGIGGMFTFEVEGGYGEKWPGDGTRVKWSVCSTCLPAWMSTFKIPPDISERGVETPYDATHSETLVAYTIDGEWAYPKGTVVPPPRPDWSYDDPGSELFPEQGIYAHYKKVVEGEPAKYLVVGYVRDLETEEPLVVYAALYGDTTVWVRPARMWAEEVEVAGVKMPRFRFIARHNPRKHSR